MTGGTDADVVVVGAGLAGSATAWRLAARGVQVVLLEAHQVGHRLGSSHGSSRIFRRGYAHREYVALTGRAQQLWDELGQEAGEPLLRRTGGIDHGRDRQLPELRAAFEAEGVPHELLAPDEAMGRWAGMRFESEVLHHPEAGVVDADATVRALLRCATARGVQVHEEVTVRAVDQQGDRVELDTSTGTVRTRRVVVAAGAWLPELLPGPLAERLPRTTVTQQQVFHFPLRDPDTAWPVLIHKDGDEIYALPSGTDGGPVPAFKVAEHERGTPTTAGSRDFVVDASSRRRMTDYVRHWLPGLVPEVAAETTCLYTTTADRDFVLDRVDDVVVASPCSGHGAKFAPALGELLAELTLTDAPGPDRFALRPRRRSTMEVGAG